MIAGVKGRLQVYANFFYSSNSRSFLVYSLVTSCGDGLTVTHNRDAHQAAVFDGNVSDSVLGYQLHPRHRADRLSREESGDTVGFLSDAECC